MYKRQVRTGTSKLWENNSFLLADKRVGLPLSVKPVLILNIPDLVKLISVLPSYGMTKIGIREPNLEVMQSYVVLGLFSVPTQSYLPSLSMLMSTLIP